MADISTAVSMARVPILGEDGRISDDYIPAAIGESVTRAESAATRAESAKTDAEAAKAGAETAKTAAQSAKTAAETAQKGAESAKTAAETAKTAAEKAKTEAAGSASKAADSATQAAQSAQQVADKYITGATAATLGPGEQATAQVVEQVLQLGIPTGERGPKGDPGVGVPDGGEPGQLLSKTDSGTAWVDPPSGNVLVGTAEGYVAHAEDAYAAKPMEVRIEGRTVRNLWPVINLSDGTVTTDETGLITINATPASTLYANAKAQGIVANKSYTLTASNASNASNSTWMIYVEESDVSGTYIASHLLGSNNSTATFTTAADCAQLVCMIIVYAGYSANLTTRVMLVEGNTAPDCFVPTGLHSVEPTKLVTAGKNLFPTGSDDGWYKGGYTRSCATIQRSVPVTLPYSSANEFSGVGNAFRVVAGQAYTLTVTGYPENFSTGLCWALYETLEDTNDPAKAVKSMYAGGAQKTLTTDALPISGYLVVCVAGQWTDGTTNFGEYPSGMRIQCELGSTATDYEPPTITQTPLPEVELRGLPDGTCDELVIKADGTATVERRTQLSGGEVTALPEPTTEPQSPVTLPALPAPTFNAYHDSKVPSDTAVTYERDINIALEQLEAKIAALNVAQATS